MVPKIKETVFTKIFNTIEDINEMCWKILTIFSDVAEESLQRIFQYLPLIVFFLIVYVVTRCLL